MSYWLNIHIQSRNQLHAGGPSLARCPTAYRVQGHLHGVAVPIGPHSNLPVKSIDLNRVFKVVTPSARRRGGCSQYRLPVVAPSVWNGLHCIIDNMGSVPEKPSFVSYLEHFLTHSIIN